MKNDELQNPTTARYYVDGNIIYEDGTGNHSYVSADKGVFIPGAVEEIENTNSKLPDELAVAIKRLETAQEDIAEKTTDLLVVSAGKIDEEETWLLSSRSNPKCIVEIAHSDLSDIDLMQLSENMQDEQAPRGMSAPYLVIVDAPYFAFI